VEKMQFIFFVHVSPNEELEVTDEKTCGPAEVHGWLV
jgi:hypothetical protein